MTTPTPPPPEKPSDEVLATIDSVKFAAILYDAGLVHHSNVAAVALHIDRHIAPLRTRLATLEGELTAERNLHGQTRVVVEELNTICNDLRNAGQPQFIRSEAIRLLREDQADLRGRITSLESDLARCKEERDALGVQVSAHEESMEIAGEKAGRIIGDLMTDRDAARLKLAEAEKDTARLDWLLKNDHDLVFEEGDPQVGVFSAWQVWKNCKWQNERPLMVAYDDDLRTAIDKAIEKRRAAQPATGAQEKGSA